MIKKNKWIKLNIHIPCFAKGLMYCLFKIYLSIKTSKQLIYSYISGPSNHLLDKRNSIGAFNIDLLVKLFNDRLP